MHEYLIVDTIPSNKYVPTMYIYELAACDFLISPESPLHVDAKIWIKFEGNQTCWDALGFWIYHKNTKNKYWKLTKKHISDSPAKF